MSNLFFTESELKEILYQLKSKNFFERLDIPYNADQVNIELSAEVALAMYNPASYPHNLSEEGKKLMSEIYNLIQEAATTLLDENTRKRYFESLNIERGDIAKTLVIPASSKANIETLKENSKPLSQNQQTDSKTSEDKKAGDLWKFVENATAPSTETPAEFEPTRSLIARFNKIVGDIGKTLFGTEKIKEDKALKKAKKDEDDFPWEAEFQEEMQFEEAEPFKKEKASKEPLFDPQSSIAMFYEELLKEKELKTTIANEKVIVPKSKTRDMENVYNVSKSIAMLFKDMLETEKRSQVEAKKKSEKKAESTDGLADKTLPLSTDKVPSPDKLESEEKIKNIYDISSSIESIFQEMIEKEKETIKLEKDLLDENDKRIERIKSLEETFNASKTLNLYLKDLLASSRINFDVPQIEEDDDKKDKKPTSPQDKLEKLEKVYKASEKLSKEIKIALEECVEDPSRKALEKFRKEQRILEQAERKTSQITKEEAKSHHVLNIPMQKSGHITVKPSHKYSAQKPQAPSRKKYEPIVPYKKSSSLLFKFLLFLALLLIVLTTFFYGKYLDLII